MATFGRNKLADPPPVTDPFTPAEGIHENDPNPAPIDPMTDYVSDPAPENMTETPAETPASEEKPKRRGRPKLADLPPVSLDELGEAEDVPEDEWDSNPLTESQAAPRSATQIAVDEKVAAVHEAWIKADKPGVRQAPRSRYTVAPEHAATTRRMLTFAGTLHKVKVTPTTHFDANGKAVIVFTVTDRPPAVKKSDKKK